MPRCLCRLVVVWSVFVTGGSAQEPPAPPPATLDLLLPAGAKATVDGQAVDDPRTVPVSDLKPGDFRRVKVAVRFADGSSDERLVDVASGQHIRLAIPQPGPERAFVIGAHPLVPINSAAISRDGRQIALGLDAGTVVLWDTLAGRPFRTLAGHQKPVLSVAFMPDGKTLISGSADTSILLWDIGTGKPVRTFKGHTGAVVSLAVSPDGKRFLSGSPEGLAIHWETDTGEPVHKLKGRSILGVAYSPDGKKLATSSADASATLWDAATGKQLTVLRGHREDVNCVAFSPDGQRLVTGSSDDTGTVWNVSAGTRITRTRGHTVNVHSAAFTPDGRRVITGEREELVVMADAAIGSAVRTFVGHGAEILSILPRPDGTTALTASRDGTARLWDLTTGRELLTLTTDGTGKAWAAVSPDGYFDGSDAGRRALGYRFLKGGFGEVDQYFAQGYRPGLLAEIWRGERPVPATPFGRSKPPLVKLAPPKGRAPTDPTATLTADITDLGGGVGSIVVENNGIRLVVGKKIEPGSAPNLTRVTFTVPLIPGTNRIGVRASDRDGTRESAAAEIELSHPKTPGQRGRLYVVAVGVAEYAETAWNRPAPRTDAQAIAAHLRDRAGNLFDRVDLVPVFDRDATRTTIEDTIRDVAELSRPQDTFVVLLCGLGGIADETVYFAPHDLRTGTDRPAEALRKRGIRVDDIAAAIGTAPALHRALIVDVSTSGETFGDPRARRSEFGLRGTVERWSRANGLHGLAAIGSIQPSLARSLADAGGGDALDVADWFRAAAARAGSTVVVATRKTGFPLLAGGK